MSLTWNVWLVLFLNEEKRFYQKGASSAPCYPIWISPCAFQFIIILCQILEDVGLVDKQDLWHKDISNTVITYPRLLFFQFLKAHCIVFPIRLTQVWTFCPDVLLMVLWPPSTCLITECDKIKDVLVDWFLILSCLNHYT